MSHQQNYPARVHYMLHVPILAFNICVIATMGWAASPGTTDIDTFGPCLFSILTGIATVWVLVSLSLTFVSHKIPLLARILVDSLLAVPCYIVSVVMTGTIEDWTKLTQPPREYQCYRSTLEQCQQQWRLVLGLKIVAMILGTFSLGLTVVDCGYAIRLRRKEIQARSDKPCYEPDYPAKQNYIIHGTMLGLNTLVLIMMSWAVTPSAQGPDDISFVGPMTGLICTGLATIWIITVLAYAKCGENMPSLARILVDSLLTIPCYTVSVVFIGLVVGWQGISSTDTWQALIALQIIAIIFGAISLVLTVFDCGYSIRLHRKMLRVKKEGRMRLNDLYAEDECKDSYAKDECK